jgi:hypothetical protein
MTTTRSAVGVATPTSVRHPAGAERTAGGGSGTWGRVRRTTAAVTVAGAPVVLLAGITYHPFVADLRHKHDVASALTADAARWSIAHLLAAAGSALVALAFLAVVAALRQRGEWRWSARSVPFLVVGSTMFALLPAMEIAVLAAARAGADPEAVLLELDAWFRPLLFAGAAVFTIGVACIARAVVRAAVLSRPATLLVVTALAVAGVSRFLPFGAALTVGAAALVVALWPLAGPVAARPGRSARTDAG